MTSITNKLGFAGGDAFMQSTRREVNAYLADRGVRRRGALSLYAKAPLAVGLMLASWTVLVTGTRPLLVVIPCLAGLALGATLTAFCVQHDANHGSTFRKRRHNTALGWTADALLGFSSYAWRVKHNIAHHTYTNIDGYDDDVTQAPLARFAPSQKRHPWYRFQQYYIWPLYALMVVRLQTVGDLMAFAHGRAGQSVLRRPRKGALAALVLGKIIFLGWAIAVPLLVYPWWAVLATYLVLTGLLSVVMATTFQLAHCVDEASFPTAEALQTGTTAWARHEVETTVDFCPRNRVLTWLLGGLNFQIEHHLFPTVRHTHYAAIAPIVARNCRLFGVRYTIQPSLRAALHSHFIHIRAMGRLGQPVSMEMG